MEKHELISAFRVAAKTLGKDPAFRQLRSMVCPERSPEQLASLIGSLITEEEAEVFRLACDTLTTARNNPDDGYHYPVAKIDAEVVDRVIGILRLIRGAKTESA